MQYTLENVIYKINYDNYNNLDKKGQELINNIIKFCEDNKKFPNEKDLKKKDGYISRIQYYKYFNSTSFIDVYKYIEPSKIKPNIMKCIDCNEEKPFTEEYFCKGKDSQYGLKHICKECEKQRRFKRHYHELGIDFKNITDISIEQWYEYYYKNSNMKCMPLYCYTEENLIIVIKYIINNKLKLLTKQDIIEKFTIHIWEKYKIEMLIFKLGGKIKALQKCFPELNFCEDDFKSINYKYLDDKCIKIIDDCLKFDKLSVEDILNNNYDLKKDDNFYKILRAMLSERFYKNNLSSIDMFLWYFKKKNISHPKYNREINRYDFAIQTKGYWDIKEHRISRIKYYCEKECEISILDIINNTEKLKDWIFNYFKRENIIKVIPKYCEYGSLYDILIEAYPEIKDKHFLFDWEWHQFNKNDKDTLIRELKEFILYRMNDIIVDFKKDIPKYINWHNMKILFSKLNKQIDKRRFQSYYEWCCLAFPEYKDIWKQEDFGIIISKDNNIFDSYQEKDVYEFIQSNNIFKYIKSIGRQRKNGKYVFELDDDYEQTRFCPDFVIEYVNINNKKIKLNKPIILEYYGMYNENNNHEIFKKYVIKTKIKEKFYKSNKNINYIGIFPNDIKNNFKNLNKKLKEFCLDNKLY